MHVSAEIFWAIVGVGVSIILWMLTELFTARRHLKEADSRRWDQVIAWARIVEDPHEPATVKLLARHALETAGVTDAALDELKQRSRTRLVGALFVPKPSLSESDDAAIRRAIEAPPPQPASGDLGALLGYLARLDQAMARYRSGQPAEADRRIRIAMVMGLALVFACVLVVAALRRGLG